MTKKSDLPKLDEFIEFLRSHRLLTDSKLTIIPEVSFLHDLHLGADDMNDLFCDIEEKFGVKLLLEDFDYGSFLPDEPARVHPPLIGRDRFEERMRTRFKKFTAQQLFERISVGKSS